MNITKVDPYTGELNTMDLPVTLEQIAKWQSGERIQNVMPHLTPDQREFLISGCVPDSFNALFPPQP